MGFTKLLARSPAALKKSLFMAYFSLSEADADARDKIRRHTQDFGRILIALHHRADGFYGGGWGGKGSVASQGVEVRDYCPPHAGRFIRPYNVALPRTWM